ncbi:23S rRNA (guanosine(2251)-2'-O)-methyltransferase RlmB [Vulcanibacillus modesticaldus]|uniref:23S rRNA (Guanosine(2251)-2'-O)-methyltransferase RlmB n=1 Tax=Vulcanibacillus modesticaldus TaxID=337097 RepID=A0A1D2YRZ8_9BACI|nr:23S rRNA (guanosine(2251)-2'-O)-methyltransferase RlmB [Vulcanibacillus modesticaldus]OEF96399.1 23S rRNA (guanosine(2251)-2'-O)-methyltransferase RlmB [Vulcanibacillus modesticaldus]
MDKKSFDKQYIIGRNPVFEAIQSNRSINKIYIAEGMQKSKVHELLSLTKEKKIITQFVPRKKIDQMVQSKNHQGVVASVAAYEYYDLHELLQNLRGKKTSPFLVMLDEIEDPHNLGSILRTADVVGADGIIIPKRRSVGLTSTVAKTSAGAIEYVPVARVTNLAQTLDKLKDEGYWIIGTDASGDRLFTEADFQTPICLVIGSEGKGMSRLIKNKCDIIAKLPMKGHVNSLNASVAAAIIMFEVFRQRGF